MTPHDARQRLETVIHFSHGRPVWDARDREAVLAVLKELDELAAATWRETVLRSALAELVKHTPDYLLYEESGADRRKAKAHAKQILSETEPMKTEAARLGCEETKG